MSVSSAWRYCSLINEHAREFDLVSRVCVRAAEVVEKRTKRSGRRRRIIARGERCFGEEWGESAKQVVPVAYFHFRVWNIRPECSTLAGAARRNAKSWVCTPPRMTVEFFMKVSATMMRSYFAAGKKQKFGSTLSTVIDVRIKFFSLLIPWH